MRQVFLKRSNSPAIEIELPLATSSNAAWRAIPNKRTGVSRVIKSCEHRIWSIEAQSIIMKEKKAPPIPFKWYSIELILPFDMRWDIDNRIKLINDLLQKCRIVENDRYCFDLHIFRSNEVQTNMCLVEVQEYIEF